MTQDYPQPELERKVAAMPGPGDLPGAFDALMHTFEAFKQANDERLGQIEQRMTSDVVTEEKLQRIDTALDDHKRKIDSLALKALRPHLDRQHRDFGQNPAVGEHRGAFQAYIRKGDATGLAALDHKALSIGSDPDGGYLAPEDTETEIGRLLRQSSPIRAIAGRRRVSASVYKKPFATSGAATGWVGETDARPETATPRLCEMRFPTMELYAMPAATQSLLDDAVVDIDQWIAEEVQTAFAEQESAAFVSGDGEAKPMGLLNYETVEDKKWAWGKLGYLATGVDGALPGKNAGDVLIDLVYALKAGYRQNAHWVMNRKTQAMIRKIKDGDGNYLWHPAAQPGGSATLMTVPIAEAEDMPDAATAGAFAVAFGDFRRGYLIVDRLGVRILRDPYSSKPYVLFYTTKRVGGGVQNFEAIKLLKFSAG